VRIAIAILSCSFAAAAAPPSKQLVDCYGVCNRTVANAQKRNSCFAQCRASSSGAPAAKQGKSQSQSQSQSQSGLDRELKESGAKLNACGANCAQRHAGNIDQRRRCEDQCYGHWQARNNAARDRASAVAGKERAQGAQKPDAAPKGGKAGPAAERQRATACYDEAVAILQSARKIGPGQAGYMGDPSGRLERLRSAKADADRQYARAKGQTYVYNVVEMICRPVLSEWKSSLAAPRYVGE